MTLRPMAAALILTVLPTLSLAQNISGHAFEDRNGNGIWDPGEPVLPGVTVRLTGTRDVGGATDVSVGTDTAGTFLFSPANGCYLLLPADPAGANPLR